MKQHIGFVLLLALSVCVAQIGLRATHPFRRATFHSH